MFNIGVTEMIMIVGVALLVFGPNELPNIIKKVGKGLREVRRASDDLKASINLDGEDDRRRPMIRPAAGIAAVQPAVALLPIAPTAPTAHAVTEGDSVGDPTTPTPDGPHG